VRRGDKREEYGVEGAGPTGVGPTADRNTVKSAVDRVAQRAGAPPRFNPATVLRRVCIARKAEALGEVVQGEVVEDPGTNLGSIGGNPTPRVCAKAPRA